MAIDSDNMPDFLWGYADRMEFSHGFRPGRVFRDWQQRGLEVARAAVGGDLGAVPACAVLGETQTARGTERRLRLTFATGATAEAWLVLPPGPGPHPAVLVLHDHGGTFDIGKEKSLRPTDPVLRASADAWAERYYGGRYIGDELVKRGYAVLASDALGWGSRQGNGHLGQQALASNLMQFGLTLAGLMAEEDAATANLMATMPELDPHRIGALGFSMGGYRAWQVAALSPAIRAAASIAWIARLKGLMVPSNNQLGGQSAFNMLHPALGGVLDYPDFAGLAAPKPMLFQAGDHDHLFPEPAVSGAFSDLAAIWAAAGAADQLTTRLWERGHIFEVDQQDEAFGFFDREL